MRCKIIIFSLLCAAALLVPACASKPAAPPPQAEPEPAPPQVEPAPDPNLAAPDQAALDGLEEARARAEAARGQSLAVRAQVYFPDEWNAAETDNESGKSAEINTLGQVNQAVALFTRAADGWEALTGRSGPLYAQEQQEQENARSALNAAMARAGQSRSAAQSAQAPTYFANDWKDAEASFQSARNSPLNTADEINAAAAQFAAVADVYDDLAGRSAARLAQDKDAEAKKAEAAALAAAQAALQAATQRAEKARQSAVEVDGPAYFANDWKAAEGRLQTARSAKKTTAQEIQAATTQFTAAADAYDSIAGKARAQFAKDKDAANKDLQAAIARAQKSRAAATPAQNNFPADWKNAETRNTAATNAKRSTTAEMKAAAPLYNTAADAYDEIVRKNTVRTSAADAVAKAKARSEKSDAYAVTVGREMEGSNAE